MCIIIGVYCSSIQVITSTIETNFLTRFSSMDTQVFVILTTSSAVRDAYFI